MLPVGVSSGNWCALTNLAAGHPCPLDLAHAAPAIIFVHPVATRAGERASERDRERAQERDSLRQEASRALCNYCAGTLSEQSWFDIIKKNYIQVHPLTGPLPAASNNNLRSCLTLAPPAPPSETCPLKRHWAMLLLGRRDCTGNGVRGPSDKLTPGMHARLSTTPRALRPAVLQSCNLHLHMLTSTCSLNEFLREPIARSLHDKVRRCRFSPATAGQPRKRVPQVVVVGDLSLSRSICRSLCRSVRDTSIHPSGAAAGQLQLFRTLLSYCIYYICVHNL